MFVKISINGIRPQGKPWTHKELVSLVLIRGRASGYLSFDAFLGSEVRKKTFSLHSLYVGNKISNQWHCIT